MSRRNRRTPIRKDCSALLHLPSCYVGSTPPLHGRGPAEAYFFHRCFIYAPDGRTDGGLPYRARLATRPAAVFTMESRHSSLHHGAVQTTCCVPDTAEMLRVLLSFAVLAAAFFMFLPLCTCLSVGRVTLDDVDDNTRVDGH